MLLVVVAIVFAFTPGIGILAVIPLAVALLVGAWIAFTIFSARTTPGQAVAAHAGPSCSAPAALTTPTATTDRTGNHGTTPPTMDRMSAEGVAVIPRCAECGAIWLPADADRWQGVAHRR
jgi:hypothetical protein